MSKVQESWNVLRATGLSSCRRDERRQQCTVDRHFISPVPREARYRIEEWSSSAKDVTLNLCERIPSLGVRLLPEVDEPGACAVGSRGFAPGSQLIPAIIFEEFEICR
jgi:hypothetical protein